MEKTISVIIPVYNVRTYLAQCVESVLGQSYTALEVLLIDDGSTDGSGQLCDSYAQSDARVRVIHQANGGAAAAKNAGLRVATGEYLAFVDSDDYLEPEAYRHMASLLEETGADAVQCSFRNVFADGGQDMVVLPQRQEFSATEYLLRFTTDWTCGLLWDKLYRRRLFADVFFEEGHIIDDEFFTYRGLMNGQKILHDPRVVYHYRQRKSGVMRSETSGARIVLDKLAYLPMRWMQIRSRFPELRKAFDIHYLNMLLLLCRDPFASEESLKLEKELLQDYFRQKDATPPPRGLWLGLARLRLGAISSLLKGRRPLPEPESRKYFD